MPTIPHKIATVVLIILSFILPSELPLPE